MMAYSYGKRDVIVQMSNVEIHLVVISDVLNQMLQGKPNQMVQI